MQRLQRSDATYQEMLPKRTGGNMRMLFAALLAAVLSGSLASPLRAETLEEIYAKAKGEGALSIYGGGPARLYEGWVKEYEERFPGIKVRVTGGYAGGLAPAIDKQIAERKIDVDFVTFQAVQEFIRWKREGVLMPFKMDGFEALDPRFRDADGAYTPINVFAIAPAFNTRLVAREDAPRSALDFLKPMFHGKLITAIPTTMTQRSSPFRPSSRNTAGSTWTTTWRPVRNSSRVTSGWSAAWPVVKASRPST
jgi:extracellular solute-binding protein